MNRMQHTRPCVGCGKILYNVGNRRKYCPECSRRRHNEQNRKWWTLSVETEQDRADTAEGSLTAALSDVQGLTEENARLQQSYNTAQDDRIAANLQRQKAEAERDKAEARAKAAEKALKHQPIAGVVDEEEVDRRAHQQAYSIAADMNAEVKAEKEQLQQELDRLQKERSKLERQVKTMTSQMNDLGQTDFETANYFPGALLSLWNSCKGSYSRLSGEDLESTFLCICNAVNSVQNEAALLCRQPEDYDGGVG